jgi:hypothetical protein
MINYEIRPRPDRRGVNLISEQLPFGRLWFGGSNAIENAASYARTNSASEAVVVIYSRSGAVIERRLIEHTERANTLGKI